MNARSLKDLLCESPHPTLLDAVDDGQNHRDLLPLLEAELQRSSTRLQRLQEHRNLLASPFYSLFPELLSRVFFIYAQDQYELYNLRWTRLLLVCRRWRDVGLATPRLWSFVGLSIPASTYSHDSSYLGGYSQTERFQVQLARSGMWPITLNMNLGSAMKQVVIPWDTLSLFSIKILNGNSHLIDETLEALDNRRHSTLVELDLHHSIYGGGDQLQSRSLPDSILRDNAPQLRRLTVVGLSLNMKLLHGLHMLSVDLSWVQHTPELIEDIFVALSRCPALEELYLCLPETVIQVDSAPRESLVHLPHLSVLSLKAPVLACVTILYAMCSIPGSVKVSVSALDVQPDLESSVAFLITSFADRARQADSPNVRALSLAWEPQFFPTAIHHNLRVTGKLYPERDYAGDFVSRASVCSQLAMSSSLHLESRYFQDVLTRILNIWPLSNITYIDVRSIDLSVAVPWHILFDSLPAVTTAIVGIDTSNTRHFLQYLSTQLREYNRRVVANIVFDACHVSWHPHRIVEVDGGTTVEGFARRIVLRTMMYCREASCVGVALDTVEIVNANVNSPGNPIFDHPASHSLIPKDDSVDWSELYQHLNEGFIYEGVLYNRIVGGEGIKRDSFGVET